MLLRDVDLGHCRRHHNAQAGNKKCDNESEAPHDAAIGTLPSFYHSTPIRCQGFTPQTEAQK